MKKTLCILFLLLASLTVSAQTQRADTLNERLFEAKVREMVYRLNITNEQKPKFVAIYRRYCEDMIKAWGKHEKPARPTTAKEAAAIQKQHIERQQRAQDIRMRYIDEFATVLNAEQLSHFFTVEGEIQKKLKALRNRAVEKRNGRQKQMKKR